MEKDSKFTRDEDGYIAIRTVSAPYSSGTDDKDSMFTRDEDGYVAVRTIAGAGGGGGDQHNLGYYATPTALREAYPTAEAGDWAIVGSTDTVWIWDTDNSAWVDSDQKGQVTSVNNQTGAVTVQETLVSGTNIKTVNNTSLLGSGNITIDSLPTQTGNSGKFLTTNGSSASWATVDPLPSQTGQSGKFLTTDGTDASWSNTVKEIEVKNASSNFYKLKLSSSGTSTSGLYYSENNNDTAHFIYNSNYNRWALKGTFSNYFIFDELNTCIRTNSTGGSLGNSSVKWDSIYVTKINNGSDITVPNTAGTMVVADYTGATAGQALRLDSNGNAVWENTTTSPATAPTLVAANWSSNTQTITVQGVTATNTIIVSPIPTDAEDYAAAGVLCVAQGSGTLTFSCTTTPVNDLQVNVVII